MTASSRLVIIANQPAPFNVICEGVVYGMVGTIHVTRYGRAALYTSSQLVD